MFFLLRDNKQTGPFTAQELRQKGLKAYDLVWIDGKSAAWRYPGEIPELQDFAPPAEEQPYDRFYKHPLREKPSYTNKRPPSGPLDEQEASEKINKPAPAKPFFVDEKVDVNTDQREKARKELQLKRKTLPEENMPRDNASVFKEAIHHTRSNRQTNLPPDFEQEGFPPPEKILKETAVIKVIIADDHSLFRGGVKTALAHRKDVNLVAEAENGKQLLTMLKHLEPDVILLDIQMPIMDGLATLPEIRKIYPSVKIIVLSMHNDQSMISKMMEIGANSYLTKSADSSTIYQAIKTCYEEEYFFNDTTNKALLTSLRTKNSAPEKIEPPAPVQVFAEDIISPVQQTITSDKPKKRIPVLSIIVGLALTGALVFAGMSIRQNNSAATQPTEGSTADSAIKQSVVVPQQVAIPDTVTQTVSLPVDSTIQSTDSIGSLPKGKLSISTVKEKKIKETTAQPASTTALNTHKDSAIVTQHQPIKIPVSTITEKEVSKIDLSSQISVNISKYKKEAFGGISGVQLSVTNHSNQPISQVMLEVQYILANDKIYKTEYISYKNLSVGQTIAQQAPNSGRGVRVSYKIVQAN